MPRSTSCLPTRASVGTGRPPRRACATTSSRSRSGATAGSGCWATSGWAESSPTTWGSARRCRRSPRSSRSDRSTGIGPTLVVCPMSVSQQWGREVARFAPGLRVHVHHGPTRLRGAAFLAAVAGNDVVITSYDVATRDADLLAAITWDRLLLDEAQDVKNARTKRHRALRRVPRTGRSRSPARRSRTASGALAIAELVNPGLLARSREAFERSFARLIEVRRDAHALERLRARRAVRPPPDEGRARGRPGAPADHDHQGRLQPDGRAGGPLPGCRRPLAAADRAARAPVRPPRRRARDARPAEAALQSPWSLSSPPAGRSRGAPESSSGSSSCWRTSRRTTRRSSSPSTWASGASRRISGRAARAGRRLLPRRSLGGARDELLARFDRADGPSLLVVSLAGGRGSTFRRRTM